MIRLGISLLSTFAIGILITPIVIFAINKLKAKQTILSYVTQHQEKVGIPTMGGIIFLLPLLFSFLFYKGEKTLATTAVIITFGYALIGALDDLLKVVFQRNLGLKAYQKIISQVVLACIATYFAYNSPYIGTSIYLPFFEESIDLSWWYLPISIFIYIATTNSVNLIDGLDGLAGSTVSIYLLTFFAIIIMILFELNYQGRTFYQEEYYNLTIFIACLIGGIMAFLLKNSYKAKIFMGDTGSLALGGACTVLPLFIKNPILILIVGIMFVVSSISVIVQVIVFKIKKKRLFLMSPLHHHFEVKGVNESKIVAYYTIITAIAGVISIIIF